MYCTCARAGIRLYQNAGGYHPRSGTVSVFLGSKWVAVCSVGFTQTALKVLCAQAGYRCAHCLLFSRCYLPAVLTSEPVEWSRCSCATQLFGAGHVHEQYELRGGPVLRRCGHRESPVRRHREQHYGECCPSAQHVLLYEFYSQYSTVVNCSAVSELCACITELLIGVLTPADVVHHWHRSGHHVLWRIARRLLYSPLYAMFD